MIHVAIIGAGAVGWHASDVLAPLALGLRLGVRLEDLAALFPGHPGFSELGFAAARMEANERSLR